MSMPLTLMADYLDLSALVPPSSPFWMLTRWGGADDVTGIEREVAATLGITDIDDFGCGLCFNRVEDARAMADAMADRLNITFGVIRSDADRPDYIADAEISTARFLK